MFLHCCFVPAYLIDLRDSHPVIIIGPIPVIPFPNEIERSDLHDAKALSPMYFTLLGIVIDSIDLQYSNANLPMLVTLFPKEIEVNEEHQAKALSSIYFTLLGIVMDFSEWQL